MTLEERAQYIIETYGEGTLATEFAQEVLNYIKDQKDKNSFNDRLATIRRECVEKWHLK